jgi:hypothetical protein
MPPDGRAQASPDSSIARAIGSRSRTRLYRRNATHGAVRGLPDSWHLKSSYQLKDSQSASRRSFGMCGPLRATQVAQGSRPAFIFSQFNHEAPALSRWLETAIV